MKRPSKKVENAAAEQAQQQVTPQQQIQHYVAHHINQATQGTRINFVDVLNDVAAMAINALDASDQRERQKDETNRALAAQVIQQTKLRQPRGKSRSK